MVRKISDALWNLSVSHCLHGEHLLANTVLCKLVVQLKGSGSQVLNLQVTEAVNFYSDRNRCRSLTFSRQLTCKVVTWKKGLINILHCTGS